MLVVIIYSLYMTNHWYASDIDQVLLKNFLSSHQDLKNEICVCVCLLWFSREEMLYHCVSDILKKVNVVVKHLVVANLLIGRKKCQWGTEQCMLYVVTPITKLKRCDIAKCYCKWAFCVRRTWGSDSGFADDLSTLVWYTVLLGK